MVDSIYRTGSLGIGIEGIPDQYADGKAAQVWEFYIGCKQSRTGLYKNWILSLLRENGCRTVLDVACGTGVDSIMLLEEGFKVVSTDASDKMLKHALKERWNRRKEAAFDSWVIEEANWLSLSVDLKEIEGVPPEGFDAVMCLGNSFAHLPDFEGTQESQRTAISKFRDMLKPGGILVIDHRNYDAILETGHVPAKNVYYNSDQTVDINVSSLYVNGRPTLVTFDYAMEMTSILKDKTLMKTLKWDSPQHTQCFRLSYYPHRLAEFKNLLENGFGDAYKSNTVYADFQPVCENEIPAYYIHVVEKST